MVLLQASEPAALLRRYWTKIQRLVRRRMGSPESLGEEYSPLPACALPLGVVAIMPVPR